MTELFKFLYETSPFALNTSLQPTWCPVSTGIYFHVSVSPLFLQVGKKIYLLNRVIFDIQ